MQHLILEEKFVAEYIYDTLNESKLKPCNVNNAKYHHNTRYRHASSIIRNGILSMKAMNNLGFKSYSKNYLNLMDDTDSHVNGSSGISLAVVGLTDLSKDEYEYTPYDENMVDFLIDSSVKASRKSINYGNEFIAKYAISNNNISSIDIRLLKYIRNTLKASTDTVKDNSIKTLVDRYNHLIEIANTIIQLDLDIPIRENSDNKNIEIDKIKISKKPKILIKT